MLRKLALALIAPLLLVACATEAGDIALDTDVPGEGAALATLRAAPALAEEAGSARFEMVMAFEAPEGTAELVSTGGYDGDRMSMVIDLGAMFTDLAESTGDTVPAGLGGAMEMVVDGDVVYLRMPMLDLLTGTSGWLSASPDDLGQLGGGFGGDLGGELGLGGTTGSPSQMLDMLEGVADDVEEVGADDVRGVPTTRYAATVDLAKVLDALPEAQRDEAQAQLDELEALNDGDGGLPVDVWIDGDGLLRRMRMTMGDLGVLGGPDGSAGDTGSGAPASATMTLEVFDYGEPVPVEVPDPAEVTPIVDALPDLGALLG